MSNDYDMVPLVTKAEQRTRNYTRLTPLIQADQLSKVFDNHVFLKLENLQYTSAFKVRGAFNKLLMLTPSQREKGVVTASSGNHGAAVAYACQQLNIKAIVYVPKNASISKLQTIQSYGADLQLWGEEYSEAEKKAHQVAKETNLSYISPYNDIDVIAGQGIIGYELLNQIKQIDTIFVAVGGGGLISGIASYVKSIKKDIQVIACQPKNSPVMCESVKAGKIITFPIQATLSDATKGNLDPNTITLGFCQKYVDEFILVSEEEIKNAMRMFIEKEHLLVEGSAGVSLAALIQQIHRFKNKNIVIIVCGANISMQTLQTVIC